MFNRRQYELIRGLCLAGMKVPETSFSLARELIELGELADAQIVSTDAAMREAQVLAEADKISATHATSAQSA